LSLSGEEKAGFDKLLIEVIKINGGRPKELATPEYEKIIDFVEALMSEAYAIGKTDNK